MAVAQTIYSANLSGKLETTLDGDKLIERIHPPAVLSSYILFERSFTPAEYGPWLHAVRSRIDGNGNCRVDAGGLGNPAPLRRIASLYVDNWFDMQDPSAISVIQPMTDRATLALAWINDHRKTHALTRLDPVVVSWTDDDVITEAKRLRWPG